MARYFAIALLLSLIRCHSRVANLPLMRRLHPHGRSAQSCAISGKVGRNWAEACRIVHANFGTELAKFGQHFGKVGYSWSNLGSNSTTFCQTWKTHAKLGLQFAEISPNPGNFDKTRPTCCPTFTQFGLESGPIWPKTLVTSGGIGKHRPDLSKRGYFRLNHAKCARNLSETWPNSGRRGRTWPISFPESARIWPERSDLARVG